MTSDPQASDDECEGPQDISFEVFVVELRSTVEAWIDHYRQKMVDEPDIYPPAMWPGNWWEQFMFFSEDEL